MKQRVRNIVGGVLTSSAVLMSLPVLAFASEGEEEGFDGVGLLVPKLTEFIPMLLGFLILWFVLAKFAWPPFIGMIDKRTATIKDSLERAEQARVESERLLEENKLQLEAGKKQAAQIIADAKVAGDAVRAEIVDQAKEDARLLVEKANAAIEAEKKAAIAQLQSSVADLSVSVVGKVIGQDFSDADHRRLIERYLVEAGNLNAN